MASQTLLAAQPIYNRDSEMEAVELLYRNDLGQSALAVGEQQATSELLFNYCTGIWWYTTGSPGNWNTVQGADLNNFEYAALGEDRYGEL